VNDAFFTGRGIIFCALLGACVAQGAPRVAGDARHALNQAFAALRRITLDNGIVCLIQEDHSAPVAAFQIWVGTGASHEQDYLGAGLSHYIEHMIFKGTPTRKPGDISREINAAGGHINAYTTLDRTVFHADLPSRNWEKGLDILLDAVSHAAFPAEECAREKEVILREMAMCEDDPDRVASQLLWSTAYAVHPYRIPVIGYADVFRSMTRDDLLRFFQRHYTPDNMLLAVAGDIAADQVEAAIRARCASFVRRARAPVLLPAEPPQMAARETRAVGPHQLARIHVAYHTVALSHPDAPALDVLAMVAGRGRSSRLVREIKEKQKLVHAIDVWSHTPQEPGLFGISATFDPGRESEVVRALERETEALRTKPFSTDELSKARAMVLSAELGECQTMSGLAGKIAAGEFYARDPKYATTYLARIGSLTPADLQDVARRYVRDSNRSQIILTTTNPAPGCGPATIKPAAPQRVVLAQGIPLILREDRRLPFVYVCAGVRGGVLAENEGNAGITRLMSDLLTRGTAERSGDEIAQAVESMGADLTPFSGYNSCGLQGRCLREDVPRLLEIFADCLLRPVFPGEEVAKQQAVHIAALAEQAEQPFSVAQKGLQEVVFPGHPYRWDPLGATDAVARLRSEDLRAHHRKLVVTGNLALAMFGHIDPAETQRQVEKAMAAARRDEAPARENLPPQPALPVTVERREPKQQTIILAGFPGVTLTDRRRDGLVLLETALSGLSGRLAEDIREKRGLAYYMGAMQRPGIDTGLFMLYAGTRAEVLPEVRQIIEAAVQRVTHEPLGAAEFERARAMLCASHDMSLQDNSGLAMNCCLNELYGLGFDYDFTLPARLQALTPAQVLEAAASVLATNRMAVSIVLPEKR
jgi:zinc protease